MQDVGNSQNSGMMTQNVHLLSHKGRLSRVTQKIQCLTGRMRMFKDSLEETFAHQKVEELLWAASQCKERVPSCRTTAPRRAYSKSGLQQTPFVTWVEISSVVIYGQWSKSFSQLRCLIGQGPCLLTRGTCLSCSLIEVGVCVSSHCAGSVSPRGREGNVPATKLHKSKQNGNLKDYCLLGPCFNSV